MPGPVCFKAVNKTDKKPSHASLHSSGGGRQRIPEINKVSSELDSDKCDKDKAGSVEYGGSL